MNEGDAVISTQRAHQPPPWLGWLLLISLLVMLNTHVFITLAAGIDQYSLYAADSSVPQPYPAILAQSPYPALLSFLFNVLLALLAYGVYRMIWRYFATPQATSSDGPERNPFKQNAVALAIPVFIAMAPSLVLGYTNLKPYFVIVGALIAIVLSIVGALKDPDVNLDFSTRGYWFNVSVAAIFVMMTLAVVVTLYFQFAPVEPPNDNLLWQLEWTPYPLEGFEQRLRGGMLLFGLVSLAYMVAVLGGVLLATLHPPRLGQQSPAPGPDSEPDPLPRAQGAIYSVSGSTPEELAREILKAQEWATVILSRLEEEVPRAAQEPTYLAVLSGLEKYLSVSEYTRLMDERRGYLSQVEILVDRAAGIARNRTDDGLERMRVQTNPGNARFITLCLYSRWPNRQFTAREIADHIEKETGQLPGNINDTISALRDMGLPLESGDRVTYLREGTRVCFLDRLTTTS